MAFRHYFPVATRVAARVRAELPQDGNAGAYYKVAGELFVLGADCATGRPLLAEAVQLFAVETSIDTSSRTATGHTKRLAMLRALRKGAAQTSDAGGGRR